MPSGEDFWKQIAEEVAADSVRAARQRKEMILNLEKRTQRWKAAALCTTILAVLEVFLWVFPKIG